MPAHLSHERNLLFAGLGLHLSLLDKDSIVRGFNEWLLHKSGSLSEILLQQGAITADQKKTIEEAVAAQIENDGGEAPALASLKFANELQTHLDSLKDQDLQVSLLTMVSLQSRKPDGALEKVPGDPPPEIKDPLLLSKQGEYRFQRTQFLEAGNLGEIWFAKDVELNRTVVLKYIKGEQQSNRYTKALFKLEGEVTGCLEHPAVVPVYGMGQDEKERPYYAMRYIRGRKLTRAIAAYHALPPNAFGKRREALGDLLQVFQTACLAVEFAHSKGVLHCDLKPDNIVVGQYGETFVVDWGLTIIKSQSQGFSSHSPENDLDAVMGETSWPYSPSRTARMGLHMTQGGMRHFIGGTMAYMSPEQVRATRGGDVEEMTHSCDLFSLGTILYHILTNRPPYSPNKEQGETLASLEGRVARGIYPLPRKVMPGVPKALEAVVMKSMAVNPQGRYASAREMAEEVKHWLAEEPVLAYRENLFEQSRRWGKNHRTAVGALVMLLGCLALGGFLYGLVTQGFNTKLSQSEKKAKEQELIAKKQEKLAKRREAIAIGAVKQFSEAVSKNPDLKNRLELEPLRKELLEEPIRFFKELTEELRGEENPSQKSLSDLAGGLFGLASLTTEIGNHEDAIRSYKEAVAIQEVLVRNYPENSEFQSNLAHSRINLANLYRFTNRLKEAEESYQKALAIRETLGKANPTNAEYQMALARLENNLAGLFSETNRLNEAEECYQKALALHEALVRANPTNSKYLGDLANSQNNLGTLYRAKNRLNEAEESYHRALSIQESLIRANPEIAKFQNDLASSHNNLANLYRATNRPKEAEDSLQKALSIQETSARANPTNSKFQNDLAISHHNLGALFRITNRPKEAEKSYQKALSIQDIMVKANPTNSKFQNDLAISHNNLANLFRITNRPIEAEKSYQKALSIQENILKANPTNSKFQYDLAKSHNNLAFLYSNTNRLKEAETSYQKTIVIFESLIKANPTNSAIHNDLARSQHNLGILYKETNRPQKAEEVYQQALSIREKLIKATPTNAELQKDLASLHNSFAILYRATDRPKEAETNYQKAKALQENLVHSNPTNSGYQADLARTHNNLANVFRNTDRLNEADAGYQKAFGIQSTLVKANPTNSGFKADLTRTKINFAALRNTQAWKIVSMQSKGEADYQKGMLLAQDGVKLNPQNGKLQNTFGIAQYRLKQFAPALESLQKSNATNSNSSGKEDPSDLAFLAMTCHQLNKKAEAETYFKKLLEAMKEKKNSENKEFQGFLKEAEALLKK